ncbi:hypothetical protein [Marinobacter confluentis]|uniref:Uncharacterized protein n=1 Tax=Marinobacter confluentis TaxID=1697557 RepID=A0A4Z1BU31_9GAMM|nr:hypothetical protein [Marinobacter confluentis]TGN38027.1 hypothetical protein E5Q11_16730 [Marinobacter confluentis]
MTVIKKNKLIFLALMLVAATIFFVFVWVGNGKGDQAASSNSGGAERVVQCLYAEGEPFFGKINNTVFDEERGCHAIIYRILESIDYSLVPSYGKTKESLDITLPEGGAVSKKLYQLHDVRGDVHMQIRPSDFDAQLNSKTKRRKETGYLEPFAEDERFLIWEIGEDSRIYHSTRDNYPFLISCSMKSLQSDDSHEHSVCAVATSTCNGLTLKYTIFGNPFKNLETIDAIHQGLVRPLFEHCD